MSFNLIPRIRVNYSILCLLRALPIQERQSEYRSQCIRLISEMYGGQKALLVPSARDAIFELLLRLPQKKVIVPSYTCMVVNEAVQLANKEIIYARSDLSVYNSSYLEYIDGDCIVLATHQYGLPCNIEEIAQKCRETGAVLIEDCATSLGSTVNGQLTGTFGDYTVISFNASKTITVPPFGGVLISKDEKLLQNIENTSEWKDPDWKFRIKGIVKALAFIVTKNPTVYRIFHWLMIERKGKLQRTEHGTVSKERTEFYKYRFSEWQAFFLLKQLKMLDKISERRKYIYSFYDKQINNPLVKKPIVNHNAVCTRYAILVEDRKSFYKKCLADGVDMDFSHSSIGCPSHFAQEHKLADTVLNLPFDFNLSDKEMRRVVDVINSIR